MTPLPTPTAADGPSLAPLTPLMTAIVDEIPALLEQHHDLAAEEASLDAKIAALRQAISYYGDINSTNNNNSADGTAQAFLPDTSLAYSSASAANAFHGRAPSKRRSEDKENARPPSGSALSPRKAQTMSNSKVVKTPPTSPGATSPKSKRKARVWMGDEALARKIN